MCMLDFDGARIKFDGTMALLNLVILGNLIALLGIESVLSTPYLPSPPPPPHTHTHSFSMDISQTLHTYYWHIEDVYVGF